MSSSVEKIKSRLGIVDVISSYLKLEKAGSNYKAKCPFHNEKTPSFFVSPSRDSYHCFGCNRGGDIFSFVEEIESVDFMESLKILASRAGVTLEKENKALRTEKDKMLEILESATIFFEDILEKSKEVKNYLSERGIKNETIEDFRIGYVANEWRSLYVFLKNKGYTETLMEKAGLIISGTHKKTGDRVYYDRFRGRIIFPIEDSMGRIVGFSGRIFGRESDKEGKYINSPQGLLYDKSGILYGYKKAKEMVRKADYCVFVEGQMDVILSHQAGVSNTVATSGTALSMRHLELIKRLTDNFILAFDSDDAGYLAMERAARLALSLGLNVKIAGIEKGHDPADLVKENKKDWIEAIKNSKHVVLYLLEYIKSENTDAREFRISVNKKVLPMIKEISNKIDQAHFVKEVAEVIDVPEGAVFEELHKIKKERTPLLNKDKKEKESLQSEHSRKNVIIERIVGIILWQTSLGSASIKLVDIKKKFKELIDTQEYRKYVSHPGEDTRSRLVFETEVCYKDSTDIMAGLNDLLLNLEEENTKDELIQTMKGIRSAEKEKKEKETQEGLKKCQLLTQKLSEIKSKREK